MRRYSTKNSDGELEYDWMNIDFTPLTIGEGSYGMLLGVNVLGTVLSLMLWYVFAYNDWCFGSDANTDEEDRAYELVRLVGEEEEPTKNGSWGERKAADERL